MPGTHAFCWDIEWVATHGYAKGFPDGTYRPGADITRMAMAAFLYRQAGEPTFTPPGTPTFNDVSSSSPFFKEIEWAASQGVAGGFPDGGYHPSGQITRQALAAFLYRLAGEPVFTPPDTPTFNDVGTSHPFFGEIEWLATTGITTGYADGGYHPSGQITRQALAAFIHRYDLL